MGPAAGTFAYATIALLYSYTQRLDKLIMNQQQFADYLFQGLGRPYLYLQQHDAAPYREQLLHACVYNPIYDPQCEGSRATYLHEMILLTHDPATYLTSFRQRRFPLDWHALLPLVWHKNERAARWTIQQLGLFRDHELRQLGFDLIAKDYYTHDAVGLFVENYLDGDEQFFAALLERTTAQDGLEAIGSSLSEIFERNPKKEAARLFVDLYERGPCSICRERFVEHLIEVELVPAWMVAECRHDSNDDIRSRIAAYEREPQTTKQPV